MRWHRFSTTERLCSTISTVRSAATDLISLAMRSMSSWPMPAVGSSSSSISGSSASVVAISSARLRPYGNSTAVTCATSERPTSSISASARSLNASSTCLLRQKSNEPPRCLCSAMRTFSSTLRCGNTAEIWNERTTPSRATSAGAKRRDVLALVDDAAAGRLQELGEQIEAGGLAGPVRADQRVDGAARDAQADPVHRHEPGKFLGQILGFEDDFTHKSTPLNRHLGGRAAGVHTPFGRADPKNRPARTWRPGGPLRPARGEGGACAPITGRKLMVRWRGILWRCRETALLLIGRDGAEKVHCGILKGRPAGGGSGRVKQIGAGEGGA